MDTIRWLATNKVVVAVWGLGILAILLSAIFGGNKKSGHEGETVTETKVVETVAEAAKPVASVATAATVATTAAVASTVQAAVDTTAEVKIEEAATKPEEATAKAEVVAVADEAAPAEIEVDKATAEVEVVDATVTDDANKGDATAAESAAEAVVADTGSLADKSSDDLLMMAREAYWDNGLDEAAGLYEELITREPNVIEHKGELGNVFWRQGYPKKAAELYADIAQPMIEKGNGERVSNMVGFIGLFFPERATNIRKLLDAQ